MIKDFEEYTKIESHGRTATKWARGTNTEVAHCCVEDAGVTRALVRSAFEAWEGTARGGVFSKEHARNLGLPC